MNRYKEIISRAKRGGKHGVSKEMKIKAVLINEPLNQVEVTSIDFENRTFAWEFGGRSEIDESFDYVKSWEVEWVE
ncbi:hypothetical protein P4H94_26815 [Paenibacillus macerans]|uniref:hypothetical protein n=1 Tax=Paenibacillus macerans TaxID=44252 RepID=UPI002DBC3757|nr:hypothetical protein [Paenibacillus macerans]MEC0140459.1 hypothetical protein [Paenibacillus macerans]